MELRLLHAQPCSNQLAANFACSWSSGGQIFIVTDTYVDILKFAPNMNNPDNNFTFDKYLSVSCGEYYVADHTGIPIEAIMMNFSRENLYRSIMIGNLTPRLENTNPVDIRPTSAAWSPPGVFNITESLLSVVSTTGNAELYFFKSDKWVLATNLTECYVKYLKPYWEMTSLSENAYDSNFELHEERILQASMACLSWSKIYEYNKTNYCYIVGGHFDGGLSVWKINCVESNIQPTFEPKLMTPLNIGLKRITSVHWCSTSEDSAWIVCGDIDGITKCIFVSSTDSETFDAKEEIFLWQHKDIRVNKILNIKLKDSICFIIIKGSFIIFAVVDTHSKTLTSTKNINLGNLLITGIQTIEWNYFLICTINGMLKTLRITQIDNACKYEVENVTNDISWEYHGAHGIVRSPSGHIWGILTYPCKIIDHLVFRSSINMMFCLTPDMDPVKYVKENSTFKLDQQWECMEIFRCLSIKNSILPSSSIEFCENYDEIPLYELRIIMWVSVMCDTFSTKPGKCRNLVSTIEKPDSFRKLVLFKFRIEFSNKYLNQYGSALTKFHLEVIFLMKEFFESVINDEKFCSKFLGKKTLNEAFNVIGAINKIPNLPLRALCVWCDTPLKNGACPIPHPDQRCCITNKQLENLAKWRCNMCNWSIHEDIQKFQQICPFCDVPFVQYE